MTDAYEVLEKIRAVIVDFGQLGEPQRRNRTTALEALEKIDELLDDVPSRTSRTPRAPRLSAPTSDGHLSFTTDPTWPEVYFEGGPWRDSHVAVRTITAPVFDVGSEVGKHYWLDQDSDPPTYRWNPDT